MNLKSKIISLVVIVLLFVSGSAYSQGVFKNNQAKATQESTATAAGTSNIAGPGDLPPGDTPIGEGLAILSLLSGGYFMLKKRNSKK